MSATLIELVDGRMVASDAEEWRIECLARTLLRKPLAERRAWLADMEHKGGPEATAALRTAMQAIHEKARLTCN